MDRLRQSGLRVELSIGPDAAVPPGVDLSAYRIIQEALTNVIKHAGPHASARVDVVRGIEALSVRVRDDGGSSSRWPLTRHASAVGGRACSVSGSG
jgi:signal transduction histidine kinase